MPFSLIAKASAARPDLNGLGSGKGQAGQQAERAGWAPQAPAEEDRAADEAAGEAAQVAPDRDPGDRNREHQVDDQQRDHAARPGADAGGPLTHDDRAQKA